MSGTAERPLVLALRGEVRIVLPPDVGGITTYVALEQEDWLEEEIRFVRAWLRPGMRALDIGANLGLYTLAMARAVGPSGRVAAFEPGPGAADYLSRSLHLNGFDQVSLLRTAVSNRRGVAAFELGEQPELAALASTGEAALRVPTARLDDLVREHGVEDADFVKMDVEGHEAEVVEGGERFFRTRSPLVMLEVLAGNQLDLRALRRLEALGYGAYRLLPGPLILEPWSSAAHSDPFLLNLFACKPDRAAALAAEGRLSLDGRGAKLDELRASLARCEAALRDGSSLAHLMSRARLAWELGARGQATAALAEAMRTLGARPDAVIDEPFLSPLPVFDDRPRGSVGPAWLACAVVESLERLRHYSSRYTRVELPALAAIRALPYATPQLERRLQLLEMIAGRQDGPRAAEKLRQRSPENLNPQFWWPEGGGG
ncbi:MAG TPA: FkbM family methyltransferase [Burkholderiales bacterium]|nr:FkbM family methyltransferase [Burkholderiales bacterium]